MLQLTCLRTRRIVLISSLLALIGMGTTIAGFTNPDDASKDGIVFSVSQDGRYALEASEVALKEIAALIAGKAGIEIEVDEQVADKRITLSLQDETLESLLHALSGSSAVVYERDGDTSRILSVRITSQQDAIPVEMQAGHYNPASEEAPATRPAWVLSNSERPASFWRSRNARYLLLQNAWIDTTEAAAGQGLSLPADWSASPDTGVHIVQFDQPIGAGQRAALEAAGAEISHYVPKNALAIKAAPEVMDAVRKLDGFVHAEPYHPYFKLSQDLVRMFTGHADAEVEARANKGRYNIISFAGEDIASDLATHGLDVVLSQPSGDSTVYTVAGDLDAIRAVAHVDRVRWLEPEADRKAMNDLANRRVRAQSFKALLPGYLGDGITIAVTDSGIDFRHPAFAINPALPTSTGLNTRIKYYDFRPSFTSDGIPGDNNGHGSHVTGTILGNGALSDSVVNAPGSGVGPYNTNTFAGIAPGARLVAIEDFNSFTDTEQASISWNQGARISNNSWGNTVFEYGALSEIWDDLVRDAVAGTAGRQELIAFFAAGNSGAGDDNGTGGTAGTIGQPGNAKNVITVGAVELPRFADNLPGAEDETDSDWQVSSFSSRGPVTTTDLRVKPDIMAPGSYVLSVQSSETLPDDLLDPFLPSRDYRAGNLNSGTNYAFFSGTSMATPVAAGAGALFYQFYTNTYNAAPSPALMKAALVAGARMLNSLVYKHAFAPALLDVSDQGWGLVDVARSALGPRIHGTDEVVFLDQQQTTPLNTGEYFSRQVSVGAGQGSLKIVLAWSDVKGTAGNALQLVNDLDLIVQAPGGGGFLGNRFTYDGVHSFRFPIPDPVFGDAYNNVEVITIKDPTPGTYTIQVYGYEVATGPQDFAMVIQKGIGIEGRTAGDSPAIALDTNDYPVIAYAAFDDALNRQIFVKRWVGEAGDLSEIGDWKRLEDQWFGLKKSASDTGVSLSLEDVYNPSVAVNSSNVFVAWEHHANDSTNIYMRQWNGVDWIELDDSAHGFGVSKSPTRAATQPIIRVGGDGNPVVAWMQNQSGVDRRVFVAKWNGAAWVGLANSQTSGIVAANTVSSPDMTINSAGNPVVSWHESLSGKVNVREWNGAAWVDRGSVGIDIANAGRRASITAGAGSELYVAWVQSFASTNRTQVYAARNTGGTLWSSMAGSAAYPGVSRSHANTNTPDSPVIRYSALPTPRVTVGWVSGTNALNGVYLKQHVIGSGSWAGVGGADQWPGVDLNQGVSSNLDMVVSSVGVPTVAFQNNATAQDEILVYQQVLDINPPSFAGLKTAVGGTNNNVNLTWLPAVDNFSTQIVYYVYQGTSVYNCFDIPMCSTGDVFGNVIAILTNVSSYQVTGVSNYQLRCYAVRAVDSGGFIDENTVMLPATPTQSGISCDQLDTDSDGMPDWWEYIWFGDITSGVPTDDPDGDGLDNLAEFNNLTDPFNADSDGDGLQDGDEVSIHGTNPRVADTDGDGLDDDTEIALGSDPLLADSNNNGLSDGDIFQLGFDDPATARTNLNRFFVETFEYDSATRANWTKVTPNAFLPLNYWHLSTAEPVVRSNDVYLISDRTTNTAYRFANDITTTNVNATYNGGLPIIGGLESPAIDATGSSNLFVTWKEFHDTEPNRDYVVVQARSAQQTNLVTVRAQRSGHSGGWVIGSASLAEFAGHTGVRVRFLFTSDNINNQFKGWYVDDVAVYEGNAISGWVRDVNGRAIAGAQVLAIGRGGVTNSVNGHRVVAAGKVFGSAITDADGSYHIDGLPLGYYFVKAEESSHRAEFWNGPLFAPSYAFGNELNPGVFTIDAVSPAGYLDLSTASTAAECHFELELGESSAFLGAAHSTGAATLPVLVDFWNARVWNGSTSTPAFVDLTASSVFNLPINAPDWESNPVTPNYFAAAAPGPHWVGVLTSDVTIAQTAVQLREGEYTSVDFSTNAGQGYLYVASLDGISHPVFLNGRDTGSSTPLLLKVQAGEHLVSLVPGGSPKIAPKRIHVPLGARTNVSFSTADTSRNGSSLLVTARDPFGNAITGATVILNGIVLTTNDVDAVNAWTPLDIGGLHQGVHRITLAKDGYRRTEVRQIVLGTGTVATTEFVLRQADEDYDLVGDATEILGYTNVFEFSRSDDPDVDGINNRQEFEFFRTYGIVLNPFLADSDADGMEDGEEVGYDGLFSIGSHMLFAWSELETNAVQGGSSIKIHFRGRYLEGIDNFGSGTQIVASIAGDHFIAGAISQTTPSVPTVEPALTILSGISPTVASFAISQGHNRGAAVFADTNPADKDTDADGMWDGFENDYKFITNALFAVERILDPIESGENLRDPDSDGLSNEKEFLGPDGIANLGDSSDPRNSDTDGDMMPDGWEYTYGFNPNDPADALLDADDDGLPNNLEYLVGANPLLEDTDADGLLDGDEVLVYGSDPVNPDTDGDDLLDGVEVDLGTNPGLRDTDGDGMPDGFEVLDIYGNLRPEGQRLNPLDPTDADEDYDGDGLTNLEEYLVRDALFGNHPADEPLFPFIWGGYVQPGWDFAFQPYAPQFPVWDYSTDPFNADTDGDGIPDGYEVVNGLHPVDPVVVNGNLLYRYGDLAAYGDLDFDGLWNDLEYKIRFALDPAASTNAINSMSTHPWRSDTDGDGLDDGEEYRTMLLGNPVLQDTDRDRLMDGAGIPGKAGEVESSLRRQFAAVDCPGCSWQDALILALLTPSPNDPNVFGHLATAANAREFGEILDAVGGVGSNIAIGAYAPLTTFNIFLSLAGLSVTNGFQYEPFIFQNFGTNLPPLLDPAETGTFNAVVINAAGDYFVVNATSDVIDRFVIEWPDVPQVTNHYDMAYNDIWQLTFAADAGLGAPHWDPITPENLPEELPPPRWGHAMTYVPGYEIKDQRGDKDDQFGPGTHMLLDNRKLVVIGGVDGVDKKADIWEYWIKSNLWVRSVESLVGAANNNFFSPEISSGLSDLNAVLLMGYANTKATCDGDAIWENGGVNFGEPKDRPWDRGYQNSSYDMTYILGGWNDDHWYGFNEPLDTIYYKSTDDTDPIVELSKDGDFNQFETFDVWQSAEFVSSTDTNGTTSANTSTVYADLDGEARDQLENGGDNESVPLGPYADTLITTNDGAVITTTATNVATAIRIDRFPFRINCDRLIGGSLIVDLISGPSADLDLHIVAEYDNFDIDPQSKSYVEGTTYGTPLERAAGVRFVTTNSVPFTIPAGTNGQYRIDITDLLIEVYSQPGWEGRAIGFVITNDVGVTDFAIMRENSAILEVVHNPPYRVPAQWHPGTRFQSVQGEVPSRRKSFGMVYNYLADRIVLFGGANGMTVFGETYVGTPVFGEEDEEIPVGTEPTDNADVRKVRLVRWEKQEPAVSPEPRWGHSMTYDPVNDRVMLFGGFNANNEPLNDLWAYTLSTVTSNTVTDTNGQEVVETQTTDGGWLRITDFQDEQRPSPRAGAAMAWFGDVFYRDESGQYGISGRRNKLVIFGGTDGKDYFNDTWYYDEEETNFDIVTTNASRWVLADPGGEQGQGPAPRAFAQLVFAQNAAIQPDPFVKFNGTRGTFQIVDGDSIRRDASTMLLFGGRGGTLPAGEDTDRDLVLDGIEHELGGTDAGRDPRINALVNPNMITVTNMVGTNLVEMLTSLETVPFTMLRLGTWGGSLPTVERPAMADLETLSYAERTHGWRMYFTFGKDPMAWQGYPLETSFANQLYEIGDETIWPIEQPATSRFAYITGIDALSADWYNLWYHRHATGNPDDERDAWELGIPDPKSLGEAGAPPYARSGRWVYGTNLRGPYPNSAEMELYSPLFSLALPSVDATDTNNVNSFFLVFHEWLDLADANDIVRVDVIRPSTPADVYNRVTGEDKQTITVLASRNNAFNTAGEWRRVVVPLNAVGNESNLFVRFTLQSDDEGVAGGWYIDDIAVMQGGEIFGTNGAFEVIGLYGINGADAITTTGSDGDGAFMFGLLPQGIYQVASGAGTNGPVVIGGGVWSGTIGLPVPMFSLVGYSVSLNTVFWDAVIGEDYQVQYADSVFGPWIDLGGPVTAATTPESIVDPGPIPGLRFYRVLLLNQP